MIRIVQLRLTSVRVFPKIIKYIMMLADFMNLIKRINGLSLSWLDDTFENQDDVALKEYSRWMYNVADMVTLGSMDGSR